VIESRWLRLCPPRKTADGQSAEPTDAELNTIRNVPPIEDYLSLLDWTGRQVVRGRRRAIPNHLPPLLGSRRHCHGRLAASGNRR
jgi:hypothetical protein